MKNVSEASETLGVFTNLSNDSTDQLEKLLWKAMTWTASISSSHLTQREVWQSLRTQLIPSLRYSLVTLLTQPEAEVLEDVFMDWMYSTLPHLGVNLNITKDWRWLPWTFQGLGLPDMGLLKCSDIIQYFIKH